MLRPDMSEQEVLNIMRAPGVALQGLQKMIREHIRPGMIVAEIGVYAGAATREFHQAILPDGFVFAIDNWAGCGIPGDAELSEKWFDKWLNDDGICCEKWKISSEDASKRMEDGRLDFVYLDADHRYEEVKNDLEIWRPKLKVTGLMAGHDLQLTGVREAIMEEAKIVSTYPDGSWVITRWR